MKMKVDWKTLSLGMITSIIVTTLFGLLLSTVIYPHGPWDSIYQSSHTAITFAEAGNPGFNIHFVPLWMVIMGALLIVTVLTAIFYFFISLYNKRKEKNE
jgi:ABC-type antimicrobial peptide transport system permease subunit